MTASHRHITHLSTILSESAVHVQQTELSESRLQMLFRALASDRIRICKTDWKGHRVHALLWHLQDLKPAARSELSRHIANRWQEKSVYMSPSPDEKNNLGALSDGEPAVDAQQPETAAKTTTITPVPEHLLFPEKSGCPPDWFDRFTDWVAAVVSLFK